MHQLDFLFRRARFSRGLKPWLGRGAVAAAVILGGLAPQSWAQEKSAGMEPRLQRFLQRFPEADLNRDGTLTETEAREYQKTRKAAKAERPSDANPEPAAPRLADVPYGPHARQVLDVWPAGAPGPAPVLIFFHGGSFKAGDKSVIRTRPILAECRQAGITVVAANYRYSTEAPFPAPMHDGARVVQFVRSQAKAWNLDPARVALSGSSAGATLALWVALHDDLADPSSTDPVARFSTRVTCASPHSGTAGLEPEYFKAHAGVVKLGMAIFQLFGVRSREELDASHKRALLREASPLTHATADDPPLFLTYAGEPSEAPFRPEAAQSAWIHHVALGRPLQARYEQLGLACELYHHGQPAPAGAEVAFLRRHLRSSR
jgi:acetyl esterase